jgi:hypothetical protein
MICRLVRNYDPQAGRARHPSAKSEEVLTIVSQLDVGWIEGEFDLILGKHMTRKPNSTDTDSQFYNKRVIRKSREYRRHRYFPSRDCLGTPIRLKLYQPRRALQRPQQQLPFSKVGIDRTDISQPAITSKNPFTQIHDLPHG